MRTSPCRLARAEPPSAGSRHTRRRRQGHRPKIAYRQVFRFQLQPPRARNVLIAASSLCRPLCGHVDLSNGGAGVGVATRCCVQGTGEQLVQVLPVPPSLNRFQTCVRIGAGSSASQCPRRGCCQGINVSCSRGNRRSVPFWGNEPWRTARHRDRVCAIHQYPSPRGEEKVAW